MTSDNHLPPEIMSAWVDGALTDSERLHLEKHLATCTSCERRIDRVRALKRSVVHAANAVPGPTARMQADLAALVEATHRQERIARVRRVGVVLVGMAAAVVVVLVIVQSRRQSAFLSSSLRDELALDHLHYAPLPNPAQVASSDPAVVALGLEERLGRRVSVPSWEATTLLGGRACKIQSQWVPLVMYERAGRRISLFELRGIGVNAARCERGEGDLSVCTMPRAGGALWVAVADLPDHDLSRLLQLASGG